MSGAPGGSERPGPGSGGTGAAVAPLSAAAGRARRELAAAVVLAAVAGGLALSSAGQTWARLTVVRQRPLPPVEATLTGGTVAPLVTATGLVLLAAAVALLAARGPGRLVVGLLMAVAGGALGWSGLRPLAGRLAVDAASVTSAGGSPGSSATTSVQAGWPVLALVAGVLGVLAGVVVVLRGRSWPAMGRRYERPGATAAGPARPMTADDRAAAAWRALDRGEDPTDPDDGPGRPA